MISERLYKHSHRINSNLVMEAGKDTIVKMVSRESEYRLNTLQRSDSIIVSLTSFPARFEHLHLVIRSILLQTMKPDEIIIYLDENIDLQKLPQSLLSLKQYGLQIVKRPGDLKPHKKYYYAIKEHPNSLIITVDDDLLYPEDTIEELYHTHLCFPNCVVASRAHKVLFNQDGTLKKYSQWEWTYQVPYHPSMRLLATGCGGVLYPPQCMPDMLLDIALIYKLSKNNDDLWLKTMQILSGTKVVLCDQRIRLNRMLIPGSQDNSLNSSNVHQNKNDIYMNTIMQYFHFNADNFGYTKARLLKIGLLTPYGATNYGTKLQAYAVQEIFEKYGETEIIEYAPGLKEKLRRKPERILMRRFADVIPVSETGYIQQELLDVRKEAIHSFNQYLNIPKQPTIGIHALREQSKQYDAVICGSDQIWNPVNLSSGIYMLEFVPKGVKRVAFSPSFGVSSIPHILRGVYKRRLKHIQAFSVREESGCEILKDLGFRSSWTLDPTLVLSVDEWATLASKNQRSIPKQPYILCYFLGTHVLGRQMAKRISKETGLPVVTLPHFKTYTPADVNFADVELYDVTVPQFIALIQNASVIFTDSFHGSAFSMLFEKEFFCFERHPSTNNANTNDRVLSLLRLFQLEDRLVHTEQDLLSAKTKKTDYAMVKKILTKKREETIHFIETAIGVKL